jgi:hypothetical protein
MSAQHTIVVINNDEFPIIQANPSGFVEAIRNGMNGRRPVELHVTQRTESPNVISYPSVGHLLQAEDGHTDLVVLHQGRLDGKKGDAESVLRALARKLGYHLTKKTVSNNARNLVF